MRYFVDVRAGVGGCAGVARAGRSQVGRDRHPAGGFKPVAMHSHHDFWPAPQPARLEAQGGGLTGCERSVGEGALRGVGARPHRIARPKVE